ncbi:MAG: MATE family efflux transporter [Lachnospiraceae bacterium]|nr:MATE family efflux transporter [Lachnospiraceae bacterium]
MKSGSFLKSVTKIAIPVALQSMLQASFSIIDQIMVGSLGSTSVAAVGIAGKLSSLYWVVIGAVVSVAGIMISQYIGAKDEKEVNRSFWLNTSLSLLIAVIFMSVCMLCPNYLMGLYSTDKYTVNIASEYLIIVSFGFLPYAINMLISTRLRCMEKAALPLIFGIMANAINTVLNYVLIFGKLGFSSMGARGAGLATVISQIFNMLLLVISLLIVCRKNKLELSYSIKLTKMTYRKYIAILLPILVTEFMWSLSENIYASVYGHIGTLECAGMTLTYPIQGLMIGAFSGLAQATGILIGKELGKGNFDSAYEKSKKLIVYALIGSVVLSIALICLMNYYTDAYDVEQYVKITAQRILQVFAVVLPVKVMNMIIPGGIIKSGGQTKTVMIIELIGTWGVGVPLALLSAYVWKYEIHIVYFILSMEECVRLILSWIVFRRKKWMKKI